MAVPDLPPARPPLPPRERMVRAAARLIGAQGVANTGVRDVLAESGAPRGSFQHYFPGGKDQLVTEALLFAGEVAARRVTRHTEQLPAAAPSLLFQEMVGEWRRLYAGRGFAPGCPLAAAAADAAAASPVLRDAIRRALDTWRQPLEETLRRLGVPAERTRPLALLMISALEGALILARSSEDTEPLNAVVSELGPVLDAAARRAAAPAPRPSAARH